MIDDTTAFQPIFHPDGLRIAYTAVDPTGYTWAQTWHICVYTIATGLSQCGMNMNSTLDQMPTLVGWHGDELLYTEQQSVSVNLYAYSMGSQGALLQWRQVPIQFPAPYTEGNGVIGGGFRATSRVSVVRTATAATSHLGFSYEQPTVSQQAFVATVTGSVVAGATAKQISSVNKETLSHTFVKPKVVSWESDDGLKVEGILFTPPGMTSAELAAAPAIVFTHCGPAMAVMATFQGYGSVCARFPLESLAEAGFVVLQPNYRGSTG